MAGALLGQTANAQTLISLNNLSAFREPAKSWRVAGDVSAEVTKVNKLNTTDGNGILINLHDKKNHGKDLYTAFEHGDIDLELEYMMAKGSNSGQ
ncbi:MAG: DUF1080 domain-containing protein [Bacteroidetes bacterium]|nr:DUF1080 domain-containing protein [Bacteroidota bacterium]